MRDEFSLRIYANASEHSTEVVFEDGIDHDSTILTVVAVIQNRFPGFLLLLLLRRRRLESGDGRIIPHHLSCVRARGKLRKRI